MNINKLAKEIYEQNKAVGWWDDPDRCIYQTLQLVSTEIAEATEGERKDLMDDHLPHRKMGEVELADAMIRVLDIGGRYGWSYVHLRDDVTPVSISMVEQIKSIAGKHLAVNVALSKLAVHIFIYRCNASIELCRLYSWLIGHVVKITESQGYDLWGAVAEKLEYNKKRADHKRENRAKQGGKKF